MRDVNLAPPVACRRRHAYRIPLTACSTLVADADKTYLCLAGAVLETIMAKMDGVQGDRISAGEPVYNHSIQCNACLLFVMKEFSGTRVLSQMGWLC